MFTNILLCTHGTEGAQKAEKYLFETLVPQAKTLMITVLTIIDKDWTDMTGDDWLNTSETRNQFLDYVNAQLGREIEEDWQRIRDSYILPPNIRFLRIAGDLEETMAEVAHKQKCDLIIAGGYTKKPFRLTSVKMSPGLAARISEEKLHPLLPCPLMIVTR